MAVFFYNIRDWEFAKKFDLLLLKLLKAAMLGKKFYTDCAKGIMVNSGTA